MIPEERNQLLDRIMKNAQVLGRMSGKVSEWEGKPWLLDEHKELTLRRYYEIKREQEELVEKLRNG